MIHLDFETRSAIDLTKVGAYNYSIHPTTDVNCLGWTIDDEEEIRIWFPGQPFPPRLMRAIQEGYLLAAWNAQFERLIWNNVFVRYGAPPLPINRFYCVAALARARGYPGKLDNAGRFAELPTLKDMEGHRLMMKLCRPRRIEEDGAIVWWDDPEDHKRQGEYCKQDVRVERLMFMGFVPFTDSELDGYHLSEEINDRGVLIDVELAEKAVTEFEAAKITATDTLVSLTNGKVTAHTQVQQIQEWVAGEWKELPDLRKSTVIDALQEDDIPEHVATVLEIRLENAKAAVSKYAAMLARNTNGVLRGMYMYRGVAIGRFSSVGVQIHNLLSKCRIDTIPILKQHGIEGLRMMGDPVQLLAQMVRPTFIAAPDMTFLIGDFSQIEARITAWLAGEEKLLQVFRRGDKERLLFGKASPEGDPYCVFGASAYGRRITKDDEKERKVSKHCVLGLGFGGSEAALARSAKEQGGIVLPAAELTRLVKVYRGEYTNIRSLWYALNDAVLLAMQSVGTIVPVSKVSYLFDGEHLWCRLPSGRLICYPFARMVTDEWGDCVEYRRGNRSPKNGVMEWPVVRLWHGMEIENLAQAIAYDLLMGALQRLRTWQIRMHTHDEAVAEVLRSEAEGKLSEFLRIMCIVPEWAEGLPISAEGQISERYVK